MQVYTLKAFGKTSEGGNPAGVVLIADNMTDEEMQSVATKVGYSETAFISRSQKANYRVRFFTPTEEVDLCGHATIATFFLLRYLNIIKKGTFKQETNAGILNIKVDDRKVFMEQPSPVFGDILDKDQIAETLNISANDIVEDLPIQIVSTGLRDIIIPIKTLDILHAIKPNFEAIAKLCKRHRAVSYHLFTTESMKGGDAHCRNLSPLVGIDEEAATGSAAGALACYMNNYGLTTIPKKLAFEQGYIMKKPSEIQVELSLKASGKIKVMVGGTAEDIEIMTI